MFSFPSVAVHGLEHARTALNAGFPVNLLSAPGAAGYGGCGWWQAMIAAARTEFPALPGRPEWTDMLDCGHAPGHAMAALRLGQRALVLDGDCPGYPAVAATAATLGATLTAIRPAAVDLAQRHATRHLLPWLRGDKAEWLG